MRTALHLSIFCLSSQILFATTFTWTGDGGLGNEDWSFMDNWVGGVVPSVEGDLSFPMTATGFTAIDDIGSFIADSITFGNSYDISGDSFTLGSLTGTNTLTVEASSDVTIDNDIALGADCILNVTTDNTLILTGSITGTNSLTTTASGNSGAIVILSGNNTGWTGNFILETTPVQVSSPSNLGSTGTLEFTGETGLILSSGFTGTVTNPIDVTSTGSMDLSLANTVTPNFGGAISGSGSISMGMIFSGNTATVTFSGNNTSYSGSITTTAGVTLEIANANGLGSSPTVNFADALIFNTTGTFGQSLGGAGSLTATGGGTVNLTGANSYGGSTTVDTGTTLEISGNTSLPSGTAVTLVDTSSILDFNNPGTATLNGNITGLGEVIISGTGTVVFTGDNTYSDGTSIAAGGTLQINNFNSIPSTGTISDSGTLIFNNPSGTATPGPITSTGNVIMNGAGTVSLSSSDTYMGGTTFNAGTVQITAPAALGTGALTFAGGTLSLASGFGTNTITPAVTLNSPGGTINAAVSSVIATFSGNFTGGSSLTVTGSGTVSLSGMNTYGGSTTVGTGTTLEISSDNSLPSSTNVSLTSSNSILSMNIPSLITLNGNITGLGEVIIGGTGTTILTGDNTYSGGTTLNSGAELEISSPMNIGTGTVTFNSGFLTLTAAFNGTLTNPMVLNGSGGTFETNSGSNVTLSGNISGGGGLTKLSTGALTLSGTNSYTGGTTIGGGDGPLTFATAESVPTGGVISAGGSLFFTNPTGTATPGAISMIGPVTMNGAGTLLMSSSNTYSGGTVFDAGIVQISAPPGLGTGPLTFNGGTLEVLSAFGIGTITPNATLNSSGGTIKTDTLAATFSGGFSGTGGLTISGTGTVILSGSNSYMGTTNIASPATLEISSTSSLPNNPVTDNGTLFFNNLAGTLTFTNDISGTGNLNVGMNSTVILSGTNSYSGTTSISSSSGILQINTVSSIPPHTHVTDEGSLIFNYPSGSLSFTGKIDGTGSLTIEGGGTLELSNSKSSYSGGTTIAAASTLQITNPAAVGTGTITIAGTLEFLPGFGENSIGNPMTLVAPSPTIQADSGAIPFLFENIGGAGPLTTTGGGTLVFVGANNYTGGTDVNQGSLLIAGSINGTTTVASGALLGGTGTINGNVISSGIISPGEIDEPIGTLTINGNYTQNAGGSYNVQLQADPSSDLFSISGTATLSGTLNVTTSPGGFFQGETFTILTAGSGVTPGFTTLNFPSFLDLKVEYFPDAVLLIVMQQSILPMAHVHHHNPQQVLKYLQEIPFTGPSDLLDVVNAMPFTNEDALTKALDQLHPAIFGAFDLLNVNTSSLVSSFFNRHMGDVCCQHLTTCTGCTDFSFWVHPFGYYYEQNRIGEQVGFRSNTEGVVGGLNVCFPNGVIVGGGGGYSYGSIDWKEHRGNGRVNSGYLGVSADYTSEPMYLEASVVAGANSYHAQRNIHFTTIDRHARHHHRGYDFTAHIGGGGDIRLGAFYLKPYSNVDYLYLYQKQFAERGADDLNLKVHGRHANMLRSEIGLSFTRSFRYGKHGCWMPTIFLSGINECYLRKRHYRSRFQNQSLEFAVRTFNKPIYLISPGIDFTFTSGKGSAVSLRYSAELNGQIATQKGDLRFEWFY